MMKNFLIITFCVFSQCISVAQEKDLKTAQKQLLGKWHYVSSSGGFTGKGAGWDVNSKIVLDICKKKYKQTENGKTRLAGKYTIQKSKTVLREQDSPSIKFEGGMEQLFEIHSDTLILTENVNDGFTFVYVKKKK